MTDARTIAVAVACPWTDCVALCAHCAAQRHASEGAELADVGSIWGPVVVSGVCHDCGGGFCLCRGQLGCGRCPLMNAPCVVQGLALYRRIVPPPPSTRPGLE